MIAPNKKPNGFGHLRQVNGRLRTTFEKGTNPTVAYDRERAWPSGSRTQGAGLDGAKRKPEDTEMRSRHARHPGVRGRRLGPHISDIPVSNFTLTLDGGHKGLLQNDTPLCKHTLYATADITGQIGKTADQNAILSTPCGKKRKRHLSRAKVVHK